MSDYELRKVIEELAENSICPELLEDIKTLQQTICLDNGGLERFFELCYEYHFTQHRRPFKEAVECVEKLLLLNALLKYHGNRSRTSKHLGIQYTTLVAKIRKYNIENVL
jgi:transcriptional regulator with PAS, ATPase and Fis domain